MNFETPVDGVGRPLYTVTVTDSTYEQYGISFNITGNYSPNSGSFDSADLDAAVQAFADSLASSRPTVVLDSVKKTTVTDTTL